MNTKRYKLILALALFAGSLQPAFAQRAQPQKAQAQRWEYCAIIRTSVVSSGGKVVGTAWVRHFTSAGPQLRAISSVFNPAKDISRDSLYLQEWKNSLQEQEGITLTFDPLKELSKDEMADVARNGALIKAIEQLGDEGWELVGDGPYDFDKGSDRALYFKRQK
jgi:hypothetical protein